MVLWSVYASSHFALLTKMYAAQFVLQPLVRLWCALTKLCPKAHADTAAPEHVVFELYALHRYKA